MNNLQLFLKGNKKKRENEKYAVTKSICDENGNPVEWEFRPLTVTEVEDIRADNTKTVIVNEVTGQSKEVVDNNSMLRQIIVSATVFPNLYDKTLLESYGVLKPEDLLVQLVDNPGEYNELGRKINQMNGFETLDQKIEKAKN